jgi:hypothetical protein
MALRKLRVVEKTEDGPVIRLDLVDHDAEVLLSDAVGGTGQVAEGITGDGGAGGLSVLGPTWLEVLDIPIINEADDGPGVYLAAGSVLPSWPGCTVFRSIDGGATFTEAASFTQRATLGLTVGLLGNWGGGNTLDTTNRLEVQVHGGELASCTWAALLNGANLCLVGDEVLQFMTAELIEPGRYRLSNFLRARLATDVWVPLHDFAERFVLLERASLFRLTTSTADFYREVSYRAVTSGAPVTAGEVITLTEYQNGLAARAPASLTAVRISAGAGYIARWRSRTRYPAPWVDGFDAPVGERSNQFLVRVSHGRTALFEEIVTDAYEYTFGAGSNLQYYLVEVRQFGYLGPGLAAETTIE